MIRALALLAALAALPACLGPLVDDGDEEGEGLGEDILAPGTAVPAWTDDPTVRALIQSKQGVGTFVPRETAFAGGASVHVWDFGAATSLAEPMFVLVRRGTDGTLAPIAHPPIVKSLPGQPGYSPFYTVLYVEVTAKYGGELIVTDYGVDEAVDAGLVLEPVRQAFGHNAPIVTPDTKLDVGGGGTLAPNGTLYYDGKTASYFDFGQIPVDDNQLVPAQHRYVLHREGEEPLSEVERNIDMDGDGDTVDTNDVYTDPPATGSPLALAVTVAVPAATTSIDTTHDETAAGITSATQLFDPMPTASVIGYQITTERHNRPTQQHAGGI